MNQVEALESAILEQAHRLAEEYRAQAVRSRDNILAEAAERLRLREDREVLIGKALADRTYRRRVQANELKLQGEMDNLRWNLVLDIQDHLADRMRQLVTDEARYYPMLQGFLAEGAQLIPQNPLVAEVNATDLQRLQFQWGTFAQQTAPEAEIELASDPIETIGGILIRTPDNRIRVDNTFEGRRHRLHDQLHQIIVERLIPAGMETNQLFTG